MISLFYQTKFPYSLPGFETLFSRNGFSNSTMHFIVNQAMHSVFLGEPVRFTSSVLVDSFCKIGCYPDIERTVSLGGHDVNKGWVHIQRYNALLTDSVSKSLASSACMQFCESGSSSCQVGWVPAFAGMTLGADENACCLQHRHKKAGRSNERPAFGLSWKLQEVGLPALFLVFLIFLILFLVFGILDIT